MNPFLIPTKLLWDTRILKYCQLHDYEDYVRPFLQSINFDTLQKDARKYLIDMLVSNRLYEKAYDMAMEYGIDMLLPHQRWFCVRMRLRCSM